MINQPAAEHGRIFRCSGCCCCGSCGSGCSGSCGFGDWSNVCVVIDPVNVSSNTSVNSWQSRSLAVHASITDPCNSNDSVTFSHWVQVVHWSTIITLSHPNQFITSTSIYYFKLLRSRNDDRSIHHRK